MVTLSLLFLVHSAVAIVDMKHFLPTNFVFKAEDRQGISVEGSEVEADEAEFNFNIGQLFGRQFQSIPQSTCQIEYMDILGGNINDATRPGQQTHTSKQCQKRCQDTLSCKYWAWQRYSGGNCWLKNNDLLRIPNIFGTIIGPKFCKPPPTKSNAFSKPLVTREQCFIVRTTSEGDEQCETSPPYQDITGRCNNIVNPDWGATNIPFLRLLPAQYAAQNAPRKTRHGVELPNTRTVAAAFPEQNNPDTRVTSMMMQFGQFLDHDISATDVPEKRCCAQHNRPECYNIYVSTGDITFNQRHNLSATCIDFARSRPACGLNKREQVNTITAFIDASNVYGSDEETANVLRTKVGGKLMENSNVEGQLPTKEQLNRLSNHLDDRLDFVAGDLRVNEQPFLTAMHVLFMREHNRLAEQLKEKLQVDNDELLYQSARKLVIVQMQNVAFNEFLPVLLGKRFVKKFNLRANEETKYDSNVNPSLFNSFASAAFRFGHSMINGLFKVIISDKEIFWRLSDLFNGNKFNGNNILDIEPMIEGLLKQNAQKVDGSFANELTNHLFSEHSPKRHARFGGDLVARNIQRGRDHGLPGYNTFRRICGLKSISSFSAKPAEIPLHIWRRLQALYSHVEDIDVYPAAIAETPLDSDSLLGPTFSCLIAQQFHNLKAGDSFFFSHNRPSPNYIKDMLNEMKSRRLSDIICDNTRIEVVQTNVMEAPHNITNPLRLCNRQEPAAGATKLPNKSAKVPNTAAEKGAKKEPKSSLVKAPKILHKQVAKVSPEEATKELPVTVPKATLPLELTALVPKTSLQVPKARVPQELAEQIPQELPARVPQELSAQVPKTIQARVPKALPAGVTRKPSARVPQELSAQVTKTLPARVPKALPAGVPRKPSAEVPRALPARAPKVLPAGVPRKPEIPQVLPARLPKALPAQAPKNSPSRVPKKSSARVPKKSPSKVPKKSPAQVPKKSLARAPKKSPARAPKTFPPSFSNILSVLSLRARSPKSLVFPETSDSPLATETPSFSPEATTQYAGTNEKPVRFTAIDAISGEP